MLETKTIYIEKIRIQLSLKARLKITKKKGKLPEETGKRINLLAKYNFSTFQTNSRY